MDRISRQNSRHCLKWGGARIFLGGARKRKQLVARLIAASQLYSQLIRGIWQRGGKSIFTLDAVSSAFRTACGSTRSIPSSARIPARTSRSCVCAHKRTRHAPSTADCNLIYRKETRAQPVRKDIFVFWTNHKSIANSLKNVSKVMCGCGMYFYIKFL